MKPLMDATSTPLSSIFGSGFLSIVPILAGAVGPDSVLAMAAVCALAYAVGSVIRFNIKHAEPVLAGTPGEATLSFELTWSANTLEIVALASRAFAFYYMLQCQVAISVSKSTVQRAGMALVAAALGFITVFAVPAS